MPSDLSNQHAYAGTFRHAMDSKHRVTIPARWRRSSEEEQFYLLPSPDGTFLYALPPSEFQKVYETINSDPRIPAPDRRRFARHFFSQAQHCVVDRQGRLLLPDEFCRQAELDSEIVLVGTYDRFEVWNPSRWERSRTNETGAFQHVASLIGL